MIGTVASPAAWIVYNLLSVAVFAGTAQIRRRDGNPSWKLWAAGAGLYVALTIVQLGRLP